MASDKQHLPFSCSSSFQEDSLQTQLDRKLASQEDNDPLKSEIKEEVALKIFDIPSDVKQKHENIETHLDIKTEKNDPFELPDELEFGMDNHLESGLGFTDKNKLQDSLTLKGHISSADIMNHCEYPTESRSNLMNDSHDNSAEEIKSDHSSRIRLNFNSDTKLEYNSNHTIDIKQDQSVDLFKCSHCDFTTEYQICLTQHTSNHIDSIKVYKCNQCGFDAKWQHILKTHMKLKHGRTTNWRDDLDYHIKDKHDVSDEVFKCTQCHYSTKRRKTLWSHVKSKHKVTFKQFTCNQCDYATHRKQYLIDHFRSRHDDSAEVFKCNQCNFSTRRKASLRPHYNYKHNVNAEVFECNQCGYSTKVKSAFTRHVKLNHYQVQALKSNIFE